MLFWIVLICLLHVTLKVVSAQAWDTKMGAPNGPESEKVCLTGYMTDLQRWVEDDGALTHFVDPFSAVDLSANPDAVILLTQEVQKASKSNQSAAVRYLSMAKCKLSRVPTVFQLKDRNGRPLYDTIEYITLYGNNFVDVSVPGEQYDMEMNATGAVHLEDDFRLRRHGITVWSVGFQRVTFSKLRELDLRKCSIKALSDNSFSGMPKLEALYLGENEINHISAQAFNGLNNLQHLDLSANTAHNQGNVVFESTNTLRNFKKLSSLDLSFTKIQQWDVGVLVDLGHRMQRLSLCHTGLRLPAFVFNTTSMRYLDLSGNAGMLAAQNVLSGIEDTLQVLYADQVGLRNFEIFHKFSNLEILKLKNNELSSIHDRISHSLRNLQILDLDKNRITTWFGRVYTNMQNLKYLSMKDNSINLISEDVMADFRNISYLAFSGNYVVCSCQARELIETAQRNENTTQPKLKSRTKPRKNRFNFHTGFNDYNRIVNERNPVNERDCFENKPCSEEDFETDAIFVLVDYEPQSYQCLLLAEGRTLPFREIQTCQQQKREINYEEVIGNQWRKFLALLVIPIVLFILIFAYAFRKNFKYFCITMRNSATLSLINNGDIKDETTIYNYDVFVSYCNEDRDWVLDYLLPHMEKDCNVSMCLHERDFQVGLSILENIVSCMDRSRSIMLILSQRFLLSQWCQFEMHLAQHRLLETRREDLILVLLEDIPRRLRPTTLQYLMLTKTYIVWPKVDSEQPLFWKRLKKSLSTYRLIENVSLA